MSFPTPQKPRIFASFRENDKADIEISEQLRSQIMDMKDGDNVIIDNPRGQILFDGKKREIREFKYTYPREDIADEYKLYSAEYLVEKENRTKFYKSLNLSQDEIDTVRSIILSRWGKSYRGAKESQWGLSWKAYFKGMFEIIALEKQGYKDKISSKEGIIKQWKTCLEIPELFENLEVYRNFIKS